MNLRRFVAILFLGCLFSSPLGARDYPVLPGGVKAALSTGAQIKVRKETGYGLYIITARLESKTKQPIPGIFTFFPLPLNATEQPRARPEIDWIDLAIKNDLMIFTEKFNPYDDFHTYTLQWLPNKVALYVDAPNDGVNIGAAIPMVVFSQEVSQPLHQSNWKQKSGQQLLDSEKIFRSDQPQFIFNLWMNDSADKISYSYLSKMAIYPLDNQGQYITNVADPRVFYVDFNQWPDDHWWPIFRKYFMAAHGDAAAGSLSNVSFGQFLENQKKVLRLGTAKPLPQQTIFQIVPNKDVRAIFHLTGNDGLIYGQAASSLIDFFTVDKKTNITVESINLDQYAKKSCQLQLTPEGEVIVRKGDIGGVHCSFLSVTPSPNKPGMVNLTVAKVLPKKTEVKQHDVAAISDTMPYSLKTIPGIDADLFGAVRLSVMGGDPIKPFSADPGDVIMIMATAKDTGIVNICHVTMVRGGYQLSKEGGDRCQFLGHDTGASIEVGANLVVPR